MRRTDERLAAARAFVAVQPDDRRARLRLHCLRDLLRSGVAESERCCGEAAELEEAATRDPLPAHQLVIGFDHLFPSWRRAALQTANAARKKSSSRCNVDI
jgi:hypothetical protein